MARDGFRFKRRDEPRPRATGRSRTGPTTIRLPSPSYSGPKARVAFWTTKELCSGRRSDSRRRLSGFPLAWPPSTVPAPWLCSGSPLTAASFSCRRSPAKWESSWQRGDPSQPPDRRPEPSNGTRASSRRPVPLSRLPLYPKRDDPDCSGSSTNPALPVPGHRLWAFATYGHIPGCGSQWRERVIGNRD
jgi:hypothetical protein